MTRSLKFALRAILICLIVVWSLFPVAYIVVNSFKFQRDIFAFPPRIFFTPTWGNYADLWNNYPDFLGFVANSLVISILATHAVGLCGRLRRRHLFALSLSALVRIALLSHRHPPAAAPRHHHSAVPMGQSARPR
ncbi:hypothetical protein [Bosea sp. NBC_00550]|uniref:hypothetical protein n=1 Tax=Bosea sp. NBC_00550 TaxID=2969621 RepID=UPI0022315EF8|nr:hypothetical protein [Bosea sp. NBC_00550]UZF94979.1 hypothetical protein NWE53_12855 [Bosea sp. NBC_00550]